MVPVAQRSVADVTRAAYLGLLGGGLPPLAATAEECKRIVHAFQGSKINDLEAEQATEGNLRANLSGCRFIHLAAHGLVDQQNENLFGAIALTPPAKPTDSKDDGFLSVNEIFNLPLSGCELVRLVRVKPMSAPIDRWKPVRPSPKHFWRLAPDGRFAAIGTSTTNRLPS